MSDGSDTSLLLKLAVALFDEQIITLMKLDDDDDLFCISMPFELKIREEDDDFLVSTELFSSDAEAYAERMKDYLAQRDDFIHWSVIEYTDNTMMAHLRVSLDVELAKDEIEFGLDELKGLFTECFEEETDSFDNSECTLNFMWLYQ